MKKKRLAILLSPRSVSATLLDTQRTANLAELPIPADEQSALWDAALTSADAPLKSIVEQFDCAGADAVVTYHSPTAFSDVFHCSTKGTALSSAAKLALLDRVPFDTADAQQGVAVWGEDAAREDRRAHAVIAADALPTSTTVASWVERAGLTLLHATPVNAVSLAWMLDQLKPIDTPTPTACIHIGEHCSVLGFVRDKRITLARRVALTKADLLHALLRPIMSGDNAKQTQLDQQAALSILETHGIPAPGDSIDENLLGRDILPLLQPLLQRFVVETRQLLRFGVEQDDRASAVLRVSGPGANIPNLGRILAEQLEITLDGQFATDAEQTSDLEICLHAWKNTPNVAPPHAIAQIERTRFKHTLIAGTALACTVAAIDAGFTFNTTAQLNAHATAISDKATSAESLIQRKAEALTSRARVDVLRKAAIENLAPQTNWPAVVKEVTTLTPEWIRLSNIASARAEEQLAMRLDGHALQNDPAKAPQIEQYIESLKASPLISDVKLGATQNTILDLDEALRFTIELELVSYPPTLSAVWENTQ